MGTRTSRVALVSRLVPAALLLSLTAGCALLPGPSGVPADRAEPPVAVSRVEGLYENIHPSFWPANSARREYRLFVNLWVHIDGEPRALRAIDEVRVHDPFGSHWTLPIDGDRLERHGAVGGWLRLRDSYLSDNGTMLPLRGMTVQVQLADGAIVSSTVDLPPPASSTPEARFLVTEEYRGELTGDHVFALARAEIVEARLTTGGLRVLLGPVDRRATNGQIVLLDANRRLVAESPQFYNDVSREPRGFLNDGSRLRADAENTLELPAGELLLAEGRRLQEARYVYVKLRDGAQYAFTAQYEGYVHMSRSALHEL